MPLAPGEFNPQRNAHQFTLAHDTTLQPPTMRHGPNRANANASGFDWRNPALGDRDPIHHGLEKWKGNQNQVSIYNGEGEQDRGWIEEAIHAPNRNTCNQTSFDFHEHTEGGESRSPSKELARSVHHVNDDYVMPPNAVDREGFGADVDWVERYESEPRHQRIRNTPTYMSSVFAQDPLPHPIRTNPTFESHILGGAAVNDDFKTGSAGHQSKHRKWLAPADHMGDMILGSGNPGLTSDGSGMHPW